jgi:potassium efflux system protein
MTRARIAQDSGVTPASRVRLCLLLLALLLLCTPVAGAEPQNGSDDNLRKELQELTKAVSDNSELEETAKKELLEQLRSVGERLDEAEKYRAKIGEITTKVDSAPQEIARYEKLIDELSANPPDLAQLVPDDASVEQIESQIALLQTERQQQADHRSALLRRTKELPARTAEMQRQLVELRARIDGARNIGEMPVATTEQRIARLLAQASQRAWLAQRGSLETEIRSQPTLAQMEAVERTWLHHALANVDRRLEMLAERAEQARASATAEELSATDAIASKLQGQDPALRALAEGNRELAGKLQLTSQQTEMARKHAAAMQGQLDFIDQDADLMLRRLEVAGRKEILGRVMVTRLDSLPDMGAIEKETRRRNALIAATSLDNIDMDEELRALVERPQYLAQYLPGLAERTPEEQEVAQKLLDQRLELLQNNLKAQGALLPLLIDSNVTARQLVEATDEYHQFLVGNLMWVRDFSFIEPETVRNQLSLLLSAAHWRTLPSALLDGFRNTPGAPALVFVFLVLVALARGAQEPYREFLRSPKLLSAGNLWNILFGLLLALILAAPPPAALLLTGYFLSGSDAENPMARALAQALMNLAWVLFALQLMRRLSSKQGVGRRLLKWDTRALEALCGELRWVTPVILVADLLNELILHLDQASRGGPLGALATVTLAGTAIALSVRLLRNQRFSARGAIKNGLRLLALGGLAVIALQATGLQYAADIYLRSLGSSVMLLLAIKIIGDVLERWLLILRARLLRKTRDERKSQELEGEGSAGEEDELNLVSLSVAHAKLLSLWKLVAVTAALWLVWSPSLPAFNLLESVTLWEVAGSSSGDGTLRAITLFDLLLGVIIIVITTLVAKNLPSLVQVFLLEWVNVSAGSRYASGILMQYVVVAIGASLFLSTIGWEWAKLQWLVAALGVGIGFGLQEIVANFISGLIILFERPIRVGDTISVGGAEGTVRRINPRATIIETFEHKEHLIPNKELITGQVVNWSLSDSAVRVVVPVGVAYGSDVRRAMALLLEAARRVPAVLLDPEPKATFEDFGDNALVLWLRCFVSDNHRVAAWTELRTIIYELYEQAGIVISFPQRDVHLDAEHPLRIRLERPPTPAAGDGGTK